MLAKDSTRPTITVGHYRERVAFPYLLQQVEGPGAPRWIKLDRPEMTLGRGEDADVRVESQGASRQHAVFKTEAGECTVLDNDSRNGVLLNAVRVHAAVLRKKDIVQVADCVFVFHET